MKRQDIIDNIARRTVATRNAETMAREQMAKMLAGLSPKQRALHDDPATQICVVCTRQSGKTSEAILKIVETLSKKPGSIAYFIMPTRDRARDTFWDRWKEATKAFGLTDENHHETLLESRMLNGSILRLVGVPDKKRADRIRGQTLDLIVIDEAANFADDLLQYLIEHCCSAALGIRKGSLYVTSTPGMDPSGYLYTLYTDPNREFSRHFLSLADNPAWEDPEAYLAKIRRQFAYKPDDPTYQREWLGRWVADFESRVYRLSDENLTDSVGRIDHAVMAVDLGATDESAICILGWRSGSRVLELAHIESDSDLDLTSVAERIKALQAIHKPLVTMVDGAAKQSVLEIQNRHGIPLEATPKAPGYKPKAIAQVNADFRRGLIKIQRHSPLVGQMRALQWAPKAIGVRENQGQPNDMCFVAGTLVATNRGRIPIEEVQVGDLALTRHGFFPVLASGCTGEQETFTLSTENGRQITGTSGHPVLTHFGWESMSKIRKNAIVYACHTPKEARDTDRFGSDTTARSQTGMSSTTGTATSETTRSLILNACRAPITRAFISPKNVELLRKRISSWLSPRHPVGIDRQRGGSGIANMLARSALRLSPSIAFAWCVEKRFKGSTPTLPFARVHAFPSVDEKADSTTSSSSAQSVENRSCGTNTQSLVVVPDRVASVTASGRQKVYNLTVDVAHEYFANGILVSNCDSFLYAYLRASHYLEHEPTVLPKPGTDEHYRLEQLKIREERERQVKQPDPADPWAASSDDEPW